MTRVIFKNVIFDEFSFLCAKNSIGNVLPTSNNAYTSILAPKVTTPYVSSRDTEPLTHQNQQNPSICQEQLITTISSFALENGSLNGELKE